MAAPMWRENVEEFLSSDGNLSVDSTINDLQNGSTTLLTIVEHLGPSLTSTEAEKRCRGTQLLSAILSQISTNVISEKEVGVLCNFMVDRLKDHHSVIPHVLQAMCALSHHPSIKIEMIKRMLLDVNRDIHVQSLSQAHRRHLYNMVLYLLEHRLKDVQSLGSDFVYSFIQVMDGETDPRNLLLAYRCVADIAANCQLGVFVEELFEVVSCYFPIDFNPSPNDPNHIKKSDLICGLRAAMTATPSFGQFCLPALVEKISSTVTSAKVDAYDTLASGAEVFGGAVLKEYRSSLWSSVKRDLFMDPSGAVHQAALAALTAVTRALVAHIDQAQNVLEEFIAAIFKDLERYLLDPDQPLGPPSTKLVLTVAGAADTAYTRIMARLLPLLLKHFQENVQVSQRSKTIEKMCSFLAVAPTVGHQLTDGSPVYEHRDTVYATFVSLLTDDSSPELRKAATGGATVLVALPNMVKEAELPLLAQHLVKMLLTEQNSEVRTGCVEAISSLAKKHPSVVNEVILPQLSKQLNTDLMDVAGRAGDSVVPTVTGVNRSRLLANMADFTVHREVVAPTLQIYISQLQTLNKEAYSEQSLDEACLICQCLRKVVTNNIKSNVGLFREHLWQKVVDLLVWAAAPVSSTYPILFCDIRLVKELSGVVRLVTQEFDARTCGEVSSQMVSLFLEGDGEFQPLNRNSPPWQRQLIYLFACVLCSLRREVAIPQLVEVLDQVFRLGCESSHQPTTEAAALCFAGLLNKAPDTEDLDLVISTVREQLARCLDSAPGGEESRGRALTVWRWTAKAMVLRGHRQQDAFIHKLVGLLGDPTLGCQAAAGLGGLLTPHEAVMRPEAHAAVTLLHPQRVALMCLPAIREGYSKASQGCRGNYLTAVSHLLKHLPRPVLRSELPPLLPLLLQSLEPPASEGCLPTSSSSSSRSDLWLSTLTTLSSLLTDSPELLTTYVDDLVPHLLRLATYRQNMKVRIAALKCISLLSKQPSPAIVPHQTRVVRALVASLDDHKRLVRAEAVKARNTWCLLTAGK